MNATFKILSMLGAAALPQFSVELMGFAALTSAVIQNALMQRSPSDETDSSQSN